MWKVAVVQPVTEGFGFNITTETNVQLVSFAYDAGLKPRQPNTSGGRRECRFGASSLQPAGRFIGFVEQMKAARPAYGYIRRNKNDLNGKAAFASVHATF